MKNRIHVIETTFHVDEANKVVICSLECDMQMYKHPAYICFTDKAFKKRMPFVRWDGTFTVKARARCNTADTFDVKKGKMLAVSRAKTKMFSVAERVWQEVRQYLGKMANECAKTTLACAAAKDIEGNHVKELEQE